MCLTRLTHLAQHITQKEKKIPKPRKKREKKKEKFPIKEWEKAKKGKKIPDQGSEEKETSRKVFGPDNIIDNNDINTNATIQTKMYALYK